MRLAVLFALLLAVVLTACGRDTVVGSAVIITDFKSTSVDASSDADGSNPTGTATASQRATPGVDGDVTCLQVSGNRATVGVTDTSWPGEHGTGVGALIFVEDNGTPGAGRDLVNHRLLSAPPTSCPLPTDEDLDPIPPPPMFPPPHPIPEGDIVVHDALTRPQAREACRAERDQLGGKAFRDKYGRPNARLTCVIQKMA